MLVRKLNYSARNKISRLPVMHTMSITLHSSDLPPLSPQDRPAAPNTLVRPVELIDLIGNTPLIRLSRLAPRNPKVELYAKAEWTNPGGSVKDRPAKNMMLDGE